MRVDHISRGSRRREKSEVPCRKSYMSREEETKDAGPKDAAMIKVRLAYTQ
jgi:hypothetical protein